MRLKKKINIALSHLKIQKQIYFVFSLIIAIPVLAMGSFIIYHTIRIFSERAYSQLESDNLRAKSILFDTTLTFYNLSEDLIRDGDLQAILQTEYENPHEASTALNDYSKFEKILVNNTSVSSLNVYTTNTEFEDSKFVQNSNEAKVQEWFDRVRVPGSIYWESSEFNPDKQTPELTLIRSFPPIHPEYSAILVLRMDNNYLKNRIQNNQLFTSLSLEQDPIFFSTIRALQGTPETAPIDYSKKYYQSQGNITYLGKNAFSYISTLIPYKSESRLYITSMDFHAPDDIQRITRLASTIILVAILLPSAIIVSFANYFSSRVKTLKEAMGHAANGDYNIIETFHGDDELSTTFSDLKNLIINVKEQQTILYQGQIKEKELINQQQQMEFKLLVSQINPHFIYNTLETIRMMAIDQDVRDVASAIALLGQTMRYVLENTKTPVIMLDKELDYIENYLAIQKLRFDSKISYSLVCTDGFDPKSFQILPLLIQPIVENSVIHGLEEKDGPGQIEIRISASSPYLHINIRDDGVGMEPEALIRLKKNLSEQAETISSSIGLCNINHRIKLFYGEEYGVSVSSENGLTVSLLLPLVMSS